MGASAVGPDQGTGGSGVGQRLISEEPMVRSYHSFTLPLLILACLVHYSQFGHVTYAPYLFPLDTTILTTTAANWQTIDLTTMTFPAEMLVDYVRVYQREGNTNVGCDPPNYPTANYINNHPEAYSSLCSYRATIFYVL